MVSHFWPVITHLILRVMAGCPDSSRESGCVRSFESTTKPLIESIHTFWDSKAILIFNRSPTRETSRGTLPAFCPPHRTKKPTHAIDVAWAGLVGRLGLADLFWPI